ncbi:hypothetical protein NLM59_11465 [Weeksellaceae bacterium KMM 9724]|uniref:hypothetical protein n=1 Tax=Profundicola chukchiensis TaxID=2961959 RepID=UPI002440D818|nr:hypothetical protein [Profundicola chukchiensis]MDG4951541.1 hypothetical protein [Profundicola chukchiensis]
MKKRLIIFLLLIISISSFAQEVEIGTIFTIEFKSIEQNLNFKIVSQKPFNGIIDDSKIDSIIKTKPKDNQIVGVFANGKFGNNINSMLVLISGLTDYIDYDLLIKLPRKRKLQKTSTSTLFKGVKSIEYWSYQIDKIEFVKFKTIPKENFEQFHFETKIDSTCIKNADKNIEFGEQEFKTHLELTVSEFENNKDIEIGKMLKYENTINSIDVSLGHFWSLGEGIYPNEKGFKFGNPISYRRYECPYFDGKTNYFFTKDDKNIKVVSFNWETFQESNFGISPKIKTDLNEKFNSKYAFIVKAVSELLGNPLDIEQEEDSGRIDTKWKSTNGINAYLFKFKTYNEIRLYIYKE